MAKKTNKFGNYLTENVYDCLHPCYNALIHNAYCREQQLFRKKIKLFDYLRPIRPINNSAGISKYSLPFLILLITIFLTACSTQPVSDRISKDSAPTQIPVDVMAVPDAIPKYEKRTRAGNPIEYMILGKRYKILSDSKGYREKGIASWYGTKFHGRKTSNGEIYDMYAMTAAHKTLPIPSYVRVTNLNNQRSVVVRINDRGPFHGNRLIDLSYTAAVKLDIQKSGTGYVEVVGIEPGMTETRQNIDNRVRPINSDSANYLQAGAFKNQENAGHFKQKLIFSQIQASDIQIIYHKTENIHKVFVGPFFTQEQAEEAHEKLTTLGLNAMLVNDMDNPVR